MAEDGDPTLPTYAAFYDDNDMVMWVDRMAARREELGLPLTHPRYNSQIVWIKKDGVTVGRRWTGTSGPYIVPREDGTFPATTPDGHPLPDDVVEALVRSEGAASVLMDQKVIIETFFRLVRMGQTGMVALFITKGLVSPDVTDGRGYENQYLMQFVPGSEPEKVAPKKVAPKKKSRWGKKEPEEPEAPYDPASRAPPLTSPERGDQWNGCTPLLAAVDVGDAAMVRTLVALGADINRMARPPDLHRAKDGEVRYMTRRGCGMGMDNNLDDLDKRVRRTPLMLAAAQGRLALAKLFYQELQADESLTAPDGYHALRLAAEGRHREIVAMLPARRGGAWARFATRHGHAVQRIKKATKSIVWFTTSLGKIVFYSVPKFLVYTVPKELVVQPMGHLGTYLWEHRREILPAIGAFLAKLPRRVWTGATNVGRFLRDVVDALVEMVVHFVKRMPDLLNVAGQWIAATAKTWAAAIAHVAGRVLSASHTALVAVATWFRTITLADVLRGFQAVFHAIFVGLPKAVWHSILLAFDCSLKALQVLFGGFAFVLYFIGLLLFHTAIFIPRQIWRILAALGSYIGGAVHEVIVWFDPKSV